MSPSGEACVAWARATALELLYRFDLDQAEETPMQPTTVPTTYTKAYKEKLRPTPAQEQVLEEVLWSCRDLYNTALEQRITAWQRRHASVSRYEQEAELKDLRAAFPGPSRCVPRV